MKALNHCWKVTDFLKDFFRSAFPDQRLGQAFCNEFDITDDQLFYEEDNGKAIALICEKHIPENVSCK